MISEDRISEAVRHGRISRLRAWWARLRCEHTVAREQVETFTDGIDAWEEHVYTCGRCGCAFIRRQGDMGYHTVKVRPPPPIPRRHDR